MSLWFNKVSGDVSQIVNCITHYESELEEAKKEVKIKGSLERASAALPGIMEHRYNQLQEIEAILEDLNIDLRKERSHIFRKFLEHYNRQLSSRDAEKYVDGEPSVINLTRLTNQFGLLRNQYLGIIKGLDVKQWQIGHITKLRTAGMEDIVID